MASSPTEICNSALQKLGAKRIVDITDESVSARACRDCYARLRDGEFAKNVWVFSVKRATLAAEADTPDWGRARAFQLPSDFIRYANDYPEDNCLEKDWEREGRFILTDDQAPLSLRYVARIENTSLFDPLFDDALAARMAMEMCEQLTQSNSKKADAKDDYKAAIAEAKRVNGIERRPQVSPDAEWITRRQ